MMAKGNAFDERGFLAYDSIGNPVVALDKKARILFLNKAFLKLLGYKRGEIEGKDWFETCIPAGSRKPVGSLFKSIVQGKIRSYKHYENPVLTSDGKERTMIWHNTLLRGSQGKIAGTLSSAMDITGKIRSEDYLKRSREEYHNIFDSLNDSVFVLEISTNRILDVNQRATETLGYSREELLKIDAAKISSGEKPYTQEDSAEWFSRAARGNPQRFEWRFRARDGRLFWAEVILRRIRIMGEDRILASVRDITGQKRNMNDLNMLRKRFEDMAMCSADWIWEVDKDGKYVFVSGNVEQILGYSAEELIGKTPFDLMPEDEAKRVGQVFRGIVSEGGRIVNLESWNLTKQGKRICLMTNGVPIIGESGNVIGYRGVDKDVTAQKMIREEARKRQDELERFNRLAVGRELKMIELKKRIRELESRGREANE